MTLPDSLLRVQGLRTHFYTYAGIVKAVDNVSLEVNKGETLGVVGESGSGKTVTAQSVLRVVPPPGKIVDGKIEFQGKNLLALRETEMQQIRGKEIAYIFQDPTTTLDVTIQAQILDLLREIKDRMNLAMVLITHDMGIVAEICDRVTVLYAGQVCESGTVEQVFEKPKHPYTQALLTSVPNLALRKQKLLVIPGNVPNLIEPPSGCRFNPRCPHAQQICIDRVPELEQIGEGRLVHCHRWKELELKSPVAS